MFFSCRWSPFRKLKSNYSALPFLSLILFISVWHSLSQLASGEWRVEPIFQLILDEINIKINKITSNMARCFRCLVSYLFLCAFSMESSAKKFHVHLGKFKNNNRYTPGSIFEKLGCFQTTPLQNIPAQNRTSKNITQKMPYIIKHYDKKL
jgi:hypothetical protein